jgi:hypothetical protein
MTTKSCSRCKQVKLLTHFTKRKRSKDGFKSYCKSCAQKEAQQWRINSKEQRAVWQKNYYAKNKNEILQRQKQWRTANLDKSKNATKNWANANREAVAERRARRRATKKQATPPWLTKEHRQQIIYVYEQCFKAQELTGIKHHVDHIHPLTHEFLCGLHVPWNLQVITAEENIKKGNRFKIGLQ